MGLNYLAKDTIELKFLGTTQIDRGACHTRCKMAVVCRALRVMYIIRSVIYIFFNTAFQGTHVECTDIQTAKSDLCLLPQKIQQVHARKGTYTSLRKASTRGAKPRGPWFWCLHDLHTVQAKPPQKGGGKDQAVPVFSDCVSPGMYFGT